MPRSSTPVRRGSSRAKKAPAVEEEESPASVPSPRKSGKAAEEQPAEVAWYNFWPSADRCYSRKTTAMLTDFAGLAVILFLTMYFTLAGVMTYRELQAEASK